MRCKMIFAAASVLCFMIFAATAADVTGTWVAEIEGGPGGGGQPAKITFILKADGSTLTGTNIGPGGNENEIVEGKIEGDKVSFAVKVDMMGNEMKINYKGTVSGDALKLTFEFEGGMGDPGDGSDAKPMELVARRR